MSVLRNSFYALSGNIAKVLLGIGGAVVLGRILGPNIFGEFAVVMAIHIMLQPLINIGLGPAYYKVDPEDEVAPNAFFTVQTGLGLVVAVIVALLSYPLAMYYGNERLIGLFLMLACSQAFLSIGLQPYADISKNNKYGWIATVQMTSLIVSLSVGIVLALLGYGVWSLAWKFIVASLISMLGYLVVAKRFYRPVPLSVVGQYRSSIVFSIKLGLSRLVSGVSNGLDKLMLGGLFDDGILGNYDRAFQFSQYPDTAIRTALTNPILTHLANDKEPREKYLLVFKAMHLLAGLICVGFFVFGDKLILLLFGKEWVLASELFPILGILALGKVMRGIYLVLEINEGDGNQILVRSITSTVFVYLVGLFALFSFKDVYLFTWFFSAGWLIYWVASLYWFFWKSIDVTVANKMMTYLVLSVSVLLLLGTGVNFFIVDLITNPLLGLVVGITLTTVLFGLVFLTLFKGDAKLFLSLLKRKNKK